MFLFSPSLFPHFHLHSFLFLTYTPSFFSTSLLPSFHLHSFLFLTYTPTFFSTSLLPFFHLHSFFSHTYTPSFLSSALLPSFHLHSYLFLTSIVDGRYNEQKNRLQECGLKTCMYIVEGLTLTGNVLCRTQYHSSLFHVITL